MLQYITSTATASIIHDHAPLAAYVPVSKYTRLITPPVYHHYLNTTATVETAVYGQQVGEIIAVVPDPFGVTDWCCFVVSLPGAPMWSEYVPIRSVPAWNITTCSGCDCVMDDSLTCPECGLCLAECCTCAPSHLDDFDYPDYADTGEDAAYDDMRDLRALANSRIGY